MDVGDEADSKRGEQTITFGQGYLFYHSYNKLDTPNKTGDDREHHASNYDSLRFTMIHYSIIYYDSLKFTLMINYDSLQPRSQPLLLMKCTIFVPGIVIKNGAGWSQSKELWTLSTQEKVFITICNG